MRSIVLEPGLWRFRQAIGVIHNPGLTQVSVKAWNCSWLAAPLVSQKRVLGGNIVTTGLMLDNGEGDDRIVGAARKDKSP